MPQSVSGRVSCRYSAVSARKTVRAIEGGLFEISKTGSVTEPVLSFIASLLVSAGSGYIIAIAIAR